MSTAAIDHPQGALVLGPAAQVTVTAALAVLFALSPTDQGRRVVAAQGAATTARLRTIR